MKPSWHHVDGAMAQLGYALLDVYPTLEEMPEPYRSTMAATPLPADAPGEDALPWPDMLSALVETLLRQVAARGEAPGAIPLRVRRLQPQFAVYVLEDPAKLPGMLERIDHEDDDLEDL